MLRKHPSNFVDLTGQRFGRLTVVKYAGVNSSSRAMWECVCDCGGKKITSGKNLKSGWALSCGCLQRETRANNGKKNKTHGQKGTRLYNTWAHMKQRCENPKNDDYNNYGGRGICVCDEWQEFEPFYEWAMSNGYNEKLTIDRIDVNGNYEPNNCRWADAYTQHNNTRTNTYVVYKGQRKTASQWSRELKISKCRLYRQLKNGKTLEEIINTPPRGSHYLEVDGQKHTIAEWARIYDMPYDVVEARVNRYGWSAEKALTTPIRKMRKTK